MRELLWSHRRLFYAVATFSFIVNLLQLGPSFYWMAVFDRVMTSRSEATLFYLTLGIAGTLLLIMALEILRARLLVVITVWIDKRVSPVIFDALVTQGGNPELPAYPEGMRDLYTFRNYITGSGIFALFDTPWLPIYLAIIFMISKTLGLFAIGGVAILVTVGWVNERLSRDALDTMHREMSNSSRFVDTVSRNAESVLTLGMLSNVRDRWSSLHEMSLSHQTMTANVVGSTISLTRLVRQVVQIMMLCAGAWLILDESASPGVMIAATFIASRALVPVEMFLSSWTQFAEARNAYHRLDAFLQRIRKPPEEQMTLEPPEGAVSTERLVFVVPGRPDPVLKGVSFQVNAGESIGIIGPSGSGKSTLARLLVGLWSPTAGTVRFDGAELDHWSRDDLGRHIAYLPQTIELFSGTIAENIARMGKVDAKQVVRAAEQAGVHDLIVRLPKGYMTKVSEGHSGLSGGQKQRIALARALFGDPRIVVLDEPNSNLDADGEATLQNVLAELKARGVTTFVIAHRPSVLARVDRILVLRDGQVERFGTRAEILGQYAGGPAPGVQAAAPAPAPAAVAPAPPSAPAPVAAGHGRPAAQPATPGYLGASAVVLTGGMPAPVANQAAA
ncbi:MAG: type I secretion system permease/ATPase [Betaproteobacteria bacterium]|nr:type I secretion system permease/ATPase [Betaproteobacteria bacterium]